MANDNGSKNEITKPLVRIYLDGSEISAEMLTSLVSLRFEEELNTASMFAVKFSAIDSEKGELNYMDMKTFQLGNEMKIAIGLDEPKDIVVGEITALEPSFGNGLSTMTVRGFDRLHRLRFGKKRRTFLEVKDSDIVSQIAGDWGLRADVEATKTVHPYILQNNLSDLEFLLERAEKIRYEAMVVDKTLTFRKPKEDESPSVTLEHRVDFEELNFVLSPHMEGSEYSVQGWDVTKKEVIKAEAKKGKEVSKMEGKKSGAELFDDAYKSASTFITEEGIVDTSHAEELAEARFNRRITETVTGGGSSRGNPDIRAGKTLEIIGVKRFDGPYYVTSTVHTYGKQGYTTAFKMRRTGL